MVRSGAARVAGQLRRNGLVEAPSAPGWELGSVDADLGVTPDSWSGIPYVPPGEGAGTRAEYVMSRMLAVGESEPALVDYIDAGSDPGTSLEHTHPHRILQPGDRVLLCWLDYGTLTQRPYIFDVAGF